MGQPGGTDPQHQYQYPPAALPNAGTNPYAPATTQGATPFAQPHPATQVPQYPMAYQPVMMTTPGKLPINPATGRPKRPASIIIGMIFTICFAATLLTLGGFILFSSTFLEYLFYSQIRGTDSKYAIFLIATGVLLIAFSVLANGGKQWAAIALLATGIVCGIYCFFVLNPVFSMFAIALAVSVLPFAFPASWRFYRDFSA